MTDLRPTLLCLGALVEAPVSPCPPALLWYGPKIYGWLARVWAVDFGHGADLIDVFGNAEQADSALKTLEGLGWLARGKFQPIPSRQHGYQKGSKGLEPETMWAAPCDYGYTPARGSNLAGFLRACQPPAPRACQTQGPFPVPCRPVGHVAQWMHRRIARLLLEPLPAPDAPQCMFCDRAAVFSRRRETMTYRPLPPILACDSPLCRPLRYPPYDLIGYPTERLRPVGEAARHALLAERALLDGRLDDVIRHDRKAAACASGLGREARGLPAARGWGAAGLGRGRGAEASAQAAGRTGEAGGGGLMASNRSLK